MLLGSSVLPALVVTYVLREVNCIESHNVTFATFLEISESRACFSTHIGNWFIGSFVYCVFFLKYPLFLICP